MAPIRNHLSAREVNGRPAYDRQNGREAGGHRGKSQKSRSEYQFWPQGVAMGSQVGKKFIQVSDPQPPCHLAYLDDSRTNDNRC